MKNGFTLVELLAVIIILAVILSITLISVGRILNNSKTSLVDTQIASIEKAAENYYLKEGMNSEDFSSDTISHCVNLSYLISNGYLQTDEITNPKTKEVMNGSVNITLVSNNYQYEYNSDVCS